MLDNKNVRQVQMFEHKNVRNTDIRQVFPSDRITLYCIILNDIILPRSDIDVNNNLFPAPFSPMSAQFPLHVLYCIEIAFLNGVCSTNSDA